MRLVKVQYFWCYRALFYFDVSD